MTFSVTSRIRKENDNTSYALDRGISLYLGALYGTRSIYKIKPVSSSGTSSLVTSDLRTTRDSFSFSSLPR